MMNPQVRFLFLAIFSVFSFTVQGINPYHVLLHQDTLLEDTVSIPKDWFLRDPEVDHMQGVSAEKTYSTLLKGKPSNTVLVAVIDSGIDVEHEDLKDVIWINEDEIPGNAIDDDKNGYIDDIHGWNFIGGKTGNVDEDTYEVTREYIRLKRPLRTWMRKRLRRKTRMIMQNG